MSRCIRLAFRLTSSSLVLCITLVSVLIELCIAAQQCMLFIQIGYIEGEREREFVLFNDALNTFYLRLYGVNIWLRTILIVRKETRCRHIGYSYRLTARVLLYAPSHRQDNTYHVLCYTSRVALAGTSI